MTISSLHTSRRPVQLLRLLVPVVTVAITAAACGGGGASSSSSGAGQAVAGTRVNATETEYKIVLSKSALAPGTYTFVAKDSGSATHALSIDGPGVKDKATSQVSGGQSASVTVKLQKGTYELYCPVANHKQLGMHTTITVR
ncbi:MAG: plastocyanin/azurin family copper-binding protein [Actinomycetota bacterium]|nr:plastocyanin/azurin family copper-binding protein [Actinomycetota bacterium]